MKLTEGNPKDLQGQRMKRYYLATSLLFFVQALHAQNGTPQCKNRENTVCVDAANSLGWAGSDYGAWVMSAIGSLPTVNGYKTGEVALAASLTVVTQSSGVKIVSPFVSIKGPGAGALQINCTFNGNCWDVHTNPFVIWPGASVSGFSLIGEGTKNSEAVGFYIGDIIGAKFEDLAVDNFRGAHSACIWLDNINGWTERNLFLHIDTGLAQVHQNGCTKDWRWTNATNNKHTSSFTHNQYVADKYSILDGQTAFSMEGGNHAADVFSFTGNIATGTTGTIFAISGVTFDGGSPTQLDGMIDVSSECTTPCTTGTLLRVGSRNNVVIRGGTGFNDLSGLLTNSISGNVVRVLNDALNGGGVETTWIMGQTLSGRSHPYIIKPANPASGRQISIPDPGGNAILALSLNSGTALYQAKRAVSGCTTAGSIGGICASPLVVKWPASFADTNYSAGCSASGLPTNLPSAPYIISKALDSITVNYSAGTQAPASWTTIDCWAIHD
jgi:hypothetical protein